MRETVRRRRLVGALAALLLVSVSELVPLGVLVARSLSGGDGPAETWQVLRDRTLVRDPLTFAAGQALVATFAGILLGLPASFFLSRRGLPFRGPLAFLLLTTVGIPPIVTALGIRELIGDEVTPTAAIVLAHTSFATGVMIWLVTPAWSVTERRTVDAARLLGASRLRAFLTLTWPHVRRQLRAAVAVAFLAGFTALATVQILGGPEHQTFESTIATASADGSVTRAELAVLVLAQFGVAVVVTVAGHALWGWPVARSARRRRPAHPFLWVSGLLYLVPLAALAVVPLGAVARAAVTNDGAADFSVFTRLLRTTVGGQSAGDTIIWTLVYGFGSALIATLLAWAFAGLPAEWRRRPLFLALGAPFVMTPVVLALALREGVQQIWPDLDRAVALVFIAHTLLAFPIAWRVIEVRAVRSRRRLRETAQLLGDRPRTAMARWGEQRLLPSLFAATLFAYAVSAAEVGAAWLRAPGNAAPAGIALLEAATGNAEPGRPVYALATILGLGAVLAFLFAERFRRIAARAEATG
ncbi:MAG: ABC transporter permease subunit [Chloroflexi bacterium]|nr:ABC transporter permease subunit [Chloroflexota bacterium]